MILKQFNLENIKITFKVDGIETSVVGEKDKTVLDSAIDNDIDAPYSCRGGACATCIGKIKNGKVELEQNYILTDSELEDGLILTCQAYPKSENIYIDIDDVLNYFINSLRYLFWFYGVNDIQILFRTS